MKKLGLDGLTLANIAGKTDSVTKKTRKTPRTCGQHWNTEAAAALEHSWQCQHWNTAVLATENKKPVKSLEHSSHYQQFQNIPLCELALREQILKEADLNNARLNREQIIIHQSIINVFYKFSFTVIRIYMILYVNITIANIWKTPQKINREIFIFYHIF